MRNGSRFHKSASEKGEENMSNSEKDWLLRTEGLCKSFAHEGNQNHVLDRIDMSLYAGDFTVVMGSSGSGKSTLLYCLSGMDRPTSGKVFYRTEKKTETELTALKEKELAAFRVYEFGFIFQKVHLVGNLTLWENVLVPGYLHSGRSAAEVKAYAGKLLADMGIAEAKDRLPAQVSGGEAQRAAIVRAVINSPGILFADEPTGALNRRSTEGVLDLLSALNQAGQTVLMVTHDVRAALRANRILYLEDGNIGGELSLMPYLQEERPLCDRETQIHAWLSSMHW